MALSDCIAKALKARQITPQQADKIKRLVAGEAPGDEVRFLETFIQEAQESKRRAHLQVIATKRNLAAAASYPKGVIGGVQGLLSYMPGAHYSNVDIRRLVVAAHLHSKIAEPMSRYRTRNLGFSQDRAAVKRMVFESFGEASGDTDAKAFYHMWDDAAETARLRHNVAGGNTPRRKDWGFPHLHQAHEIAAVPFEKWRDDIVPRLDRSRIYNKFGQPMTDEQFDELLTGLYQQFQAEAGKLSTDIPRNVPNRPDHRLLTFKNATAWLEYNDLYGHRDIWHTMLSHLDHMAGDIALMEVLGPNPDAAFAQLLELATKSGTPYKPGIRNQITRAFESGRIRQIQNTYEVVTGRVNQTENEFLAAFGSAVRNWLTGFLGSAWISSWGDIWTARMVANMVGMPEIKFLSTMVKAMAPGKGGEAERIFLVRMGLGAEAWISRALAGERFGEITGRGITAKVSEATVRASLLSVHTYAGRAALGHDILGFVADQVGKTFKELPEPLSNSFKRFGITERHWEIMRRTPLLDREGAKYLQPADILELSRKEVKDLAAIFRDASEDIQAEMGLRGKREGALGRRLKAGGEEVVATTGRISLIQEASNKFHEMVLTEMRAGFAEPDAWVKGLWTQGQKRGSLMGEVIRSAGLFKSFATSILALHAFGRARELSGLQRGRYLAELMLGLTVFGAASLQGRNITKGKDLQDMTDPKFWAAAFGQGGGGGIMTDFLFSEANRYQKGWVQTLAGPVGDMADDIQKLTLGNLSDYLKGKETKIGREMAFLAKKYTPGGNLFYSRVAMERLFWDQLLKASDPEAHQSFRRIMQKARKDYNQEFWWKPGETLPKRAPDLGAALGE